MKIAFFGLSISSSWGNGHATLYRGLLKELSELQHDIYFFERDVPWYQEHRDFNFCSYCHLYFYQSLEELNHTYIDLLKSCDVIIQGSFVPDGVEIAALLGKNCSLSAHLFYDIDTPVTLSRMNQGGCDYLSPEKIPFYDYYLTFTGGEKIIATLKNQFKAKRVHPFYCFVDPSIYYPLNQNQNQNQNQNDNDEYRWELGYLGTYTPDRMIGLEKLLLNVGQQFPLKKFVIAGPQYEQSSLWPKNVESMSYLPQKEHNQFYNNQKFTLNLTRKEMTLSGYSPSVRIFEAAASGVPIISDYWQGLEEFLVINEEVLVATSTNDVVYYLKNLTDWERKKIALAARTKILEFHTAYQRASELLTLINNL